MNDIYEALKSGQTIEDLATAFAAELNEAEQRIRAEEAAAKEAEEAAKRAAAQAELGAAEKLADFTTACVAFWNACQKHYPDVVNAADYSYDEMENLAKMLIGLLDMSTAFPVRAKVVAKPAAKSDEDAFADFFKLFAL